MGLMELGCTRRDFGRDVQPAAPNRPRCWAPSGAHARSDIKTEAFCTAVLIPLCRGVSGEPVSSYRTLEGLEETPPTRRKRAVESAAGETWNGDAETTPFQFRDDYDRCRA